MEKFRADVECFPDIWGVIENIKIYSDFLYVLNNKSPLETIFLAQYFRKFTETPFVNPTTWEYKHTNSIIVNNLIKCPSQEELLLCLKNLHRADISFKYFFLKAHVEILKIIRNLEPDFIENFEFLWHLSMLNPDINYYRSIEINPEYYLENVLPAFKNTEFLKWIYKIGLYKIGNSFLTKEVLDYLCNIIPRDSGIESYYYLTYFSILNKNFDVIKNFSDFNGEELSNLIIVLGESGFKSTRKDFFDALFDIYNNKNLNDASKKILRRLIIIFGRKANDFLIREFFSGNREESFGLYFYYLKRRKSADFVESVENFLRTHTFEKSLDSKYFYIASILLNIYRKMGSDSGSKSASKPSEIVLGFFSLLRLLSTDDQRKSVYKKIIDLGTNENLDR